MLRICCYLIWEWRMAWVQVGWGGECMTDLSWFDEIAKTKPNDYPDNWTIDFPSARNVSSDWYAWGSGYWKNLSCRVHMRGWWEGSLLEYNFVKPFVGRKSSVSRKARLGIRFAIAISEARYSKDVTLLNTIIWFRLSLRLAVMISRPQQQ